jgi:hypothetical protein
MDWKSFKKEKKEDESDGEEVKYLEDGERRSKEGEKIIIR